MHNFTRSDIDRYLYLIAKEYKHLNKSNPNAEIILVGGSSVVVNYNFRDTTTDFDTILQTASNIKDVVNKISDEYSLPNGWFNSDFKMTSSYTPNLIKLSKHYKVFCGCLSVRTIKDEYLIAMKVKSGRLYKHDISDIVGILKENIEKGSPIFFEKIERAYIELYNEPMPKHLKTYIQNLYKESSFDDLYYSIVEKEANNKEKLLSIQEKYGSQLDTDNLNDLLDDFTNKD